MIRLIWIRQWLVEKTFMSMRVEDGLKKNPLKPEYARYGSFDVLAENNQKQMRELIDELEKAEKRTGFGCSKSR